jgi:single stranded DNA-binding protein
MNTIHILGRLGKDPETRQVGETSVTNFSVATTERYKDRHGNKQEKTQWHTVSFWGKQGEIIAQYLNKGDQIQVTGTMEYRKWQDKEGATASVPKSKDSRSTSLAVASQKAHPSHPKSRKRIKLPTVTTISPSDKDK